LIRYSAFGLVLESEIPLPELSPASSHESTDVKILRVHEFAPPSFPSPGDGTLRFDLHVPEVADFRIEAGSRILVRAWEQQDDALRLYLLGSCLGCVLQQRGHVVLHGNAVTRDGKTCKIIVGHSGAGKSTAAAQAYKAGAGILTDDVCAIQFGDDGTPYVLPGYPQIKLWKTSADLLGIPTTGLRRTHPGEEKFALPITDRFWTHPLPLTEVDELSASHTDTVALEGFDKARCLMEHSYRREFLAGMGLEAAYMQKLMRLAQRVQLQRGVRSQLA
jgi:hypothetical protein